MFSSSSSLALLNLPSKLKPKPKPHPRHIPPLAPKSALIDDGVTPLSVFPSCPPNKDGVCPLDALVKERKKRVEEMDWDWGGKGNWDPEKVSGGEDGSPPPRPKPE